MADVEKASLGVGYGRPVDPGWVAGYFRHVDAALPSGYALDRRSDPGIVYANKREVDEVNGLVDPESVSGELEKLDGRIAALIKGSSDLPNFQADVSLRVNHAVQINTGPRGNGLFMRALDLWALGSGGDVLVCDTEKRAVRGELGLDSGATRKPGNDPVYNVHLGNLKCREGVEFDKRAVKAALTGLMLGRRLGSPVFNGVTHLFDDL